MSLVARTALPLPLVRRGKVREVYAAGADTLLLVASDRISAFDRVSPEPVPWKGAVLTQLSAFWFRTLEAARPHHCLSADTDEIVALLPALGPFRAELASRALLVRRTTPVPFECVVRGYLAGSAWAEYRGRGTLAGEPLPRGLVESARLAPPLFSPATKADVGHDENVSVAAMRERLGPALTETLRRRSLELYAAGQAYATGRGVIIADTKLEFGQTQEGDLLLIDEVLTPDSSRFWSLEEYRPGRAQSGYDKQPVREYLARLREKGEWDGESAPALPAEVVGATSRRYLEIYRRLVGAPLDGGPTPEGAAGVAGAAAAGATGAASP